MVARSVKGSGSIALWSCSADVMFILGMQYLYLGVLRHVFGVRSVVSVLSNNVSGVGFRMSKRGQIFLPGGKDKLSVLNISFIFQNGQEDSHNQSWPMTVLGAGDNCGGFLSELFGFSGTNSGESEMIPKQCQLAPDIPQSIQVFSQCDFFSSPHCNAKLQEAQRLHLSSQIGQQEHQQKTVCFEQPSLLSWCRLMNETTQNNFLFLTHWLKHGFYRNVIYPFLQVVNITKIRHFEGKGKTPESGSVEGELLQTASVQKMFTSQLILLAIILFRQSSLWASLSQTGTLPSG